MTGKKTTPAARPSRTSGKGCNGFALHTANMENVLRSMPEEEAMYEAADFFRMFGDTTRIKILHALFVSELCVCDLSVLLPLSQSAVSHQLNSLRQLNLVKYRRQGKTVFYSLKDDHVKRILDLGLQHVMEKRNQGTGSP